MSYLQTGRPRSLRGIIRTRTLTGLGVIAANGVGFRMPVVSRPVSPIRSTVYRANPIARPMPTPISTPAQPVGGWQGRSPRRTGAPNQSNQNCISQANGSVVCGPATSTPGSNNGGGWQNNPNNPNGANSPSNIAALTALVETNPAAMSQQQWTQAQQAGLIPSTLPYGSAATLATSSTATASNAIDPATGIPYSQETGATAATTTSALAGVPIWVYAIVGGLVLMMIMMKK